MADDEIYISHTGTLTKIYGVGAWEGLHGNYLSGISLLAFNDGGQITISKFNDGGDDDCVPPSETFLLHDGDKAHKVVTLNPHFCEDLDYSLSQHLLNVAGQVVFAARLDNGRKGIFLYTPVLAQGHIKEGTSISLGR